jgi:hypothetical protein
MASSYSRLSSSRPVPPPLPKRKFPAAGEGAGGADIPSTVVLPSGDRVDDLDVRLEWLEQAIEGISVSWGRAQLRTWAGGLREVHRCIARAWTHTRDPRFAHVFDRRGALAAFLDALFEWCGAVIADVEAMAVKLRGGRPLLGVFPFKAVSDSYVRFQRLEVAARAALAAQAPVLREARSAWKVLDSDLEEMFWATEWLHMSLAARPGQ